MGALCIAVQRGDSAAALEAKKKELEARRAAASRAEKVYFRVTVRVSGMGVGGMGRVGTCSVRAGWVEGAPGAAVLVDPDALFAEACPPDAAQALA